MRTPDGMRTLIQQFVENKNAYHQANDTLRMLESREGWFGNIQSRSMVTRDIYRKNEQILRELSEMMKEPLDQEAADVLYDQLMELYYGGADDYYLMSMIGERLIAFYQKQNDLNRLLPLHRLLAFESMMLFGMCMDDADREYVISIYDHICSFKDQYTKITSEESRRCIWNAYGNLIAPLGNKYHPMKGRVIQIYREVYELWKRPEVQALDGENQHIKRGLEQMDEDFLFVMLGYIDELTEEERDVIIKVSGEISARSGGNPSPFVLHANTIAQMLCGEITPKEAIEFFIDYINNRIPAPKYLPDTEEQDYMSIVDLHDSTEFLFLVLRYAKLTEEEEQKYIRCFLSGTMELFSSIPYNVCTSDVNYFSAEWYQCVAPYLHDFDEKWKFLEHTVILRQPSTYIHGLMVSRIAQLIAEEIIEKEPQLFCRISHLDTVEDVRKWKKELLKYIKTCGLVHDVGKCTLAEIINQQARKICKKEFEVIRKHPNAGVHYLMNDPDFKDFYAVIRGHHKFYNGKGGYPADFDNTASPVRFIIDLITIADCMDAALDKLGRNYTAGKSFAQLMQEFNSESGTRYNPDIVRILSEGDELRKKLEYLTGEGRMETYFEAYETIYSFTAPKE
ncbi:MAG: HD domain-containing protein [Clostridiales bacterium]|nr:HD domain-containing protein [Candidatus Blautia equi]